MGQIIHGKKVLGLNRTGVAGEFSSGVGRHMTDRKKFPAKETEEKGSRQRRSQYSSVDVARLAGVSQAAVSRAFSEGASISPATKAKVLKAAADLGYRPSILPRILATNTSQLVAIVVGGLNNPFYAEIFEIFVRKLQENGYQSLVYFVDDREHFDKVLPLIMKYRVDGIISSLSLLSPEAAAECTQMDIPIVTTNGKSEVESVSSVCSDNFEGGKKIAELFLEKGAMRFGYAGGKESFANTERRRGYLETLKDNGISEVIEFTGIFQTVGGCLAARQMLGAGAIPDAVFCANDLMAVGFIETARSEFGLNVPEDLMVAGFDNLDCTAWPSIGLTTIDPDTDGMAECAIQLLKRYWDSDVEVAGETVIVAGTLIERSSTDRRVVLPRKSSSKVG